MGAEKCHYNVSLVVFVVVVFFFDDDVRDVKKWWITKSRHKLYTFRLFDVWFVECMSSLRGMECALTILKNPAFLATFVRYSLFNAQKCSRMFENEQSAFIAAEMNFNRVYNEVSKDTPITSVLVTAKCEPSSSSICSVFRRVSFRFLSCPCSVYSTSYYSYSFCLAFISILAVWIILSMRKFGRARQWHHKFQVSLWSTDFFVRLTKQGTAGPAATALFSS